MISRNSPNGSRASETSDAAGSRMTGLLEHRPVRPVAGPARQIGAELLDVTQGLLVEAVADAPQVVASGQVLPPEEAQPRRLPALVLEGAGGDHVGARALEAADEHGAG